ncbi:MAG: hypothetical protein AAFX56_16640 [Pseudomonadota bacterium]
MWRLRISFQVKLAERCHLNRFCPESRLQSQKSNVRDYVVGTPQGACELWKYIEVIFHNHDWLVELDAAFPQLSVARKAAYFANDGEAAGVQQEARVVEALEFALANGIVAANSIKEFECHTGFIELPFRGTATLNRIG